MALNDDILDRAIGHEIGLQRHSKRLMREYVAILGKSEDRLIAEIARRGVGDASFTTRRLNLLLKSVRTLMHDSYMTANDFLNPALRDLAGNEVNFQTQMLKRFPPVKLDIVSPTSQQVMAAARGRPFQGRLMKDWYKDLDTNAFKRVRDEIRQGFVEGRTTDQIVRSIKGTKAQNFKNGILEINRRGARTMVRTSTNFYANVARQQTFNANKSVLKGVQWHSTLDNRTSAVCRGRDGILYPVSSGPRPPAHPNCLPGESLVLAGGRVTGASKRWFKGEMVSVRTRSGREISATPNHPVMTQNGWIGIGSLDLKSKLLCLANPEMASAAIDTGDYDIETSIHDKAEAFFRSSDVATMPVPTAAPDFHGDGIAGEIAIIGTNRSLGLGVDAGIFQEPFNTQFQSGDMGFSALSRARSFVEFYRAAFFATKSIMRGSRLSSLLFGSAFVHSRLLLFAAITKRYPVFSQDALNGTFTDAEFIRDPCNADAFGIEIDDVVAIERHNFDGHVYNLETEKHVYFSQGIVTHNCRSTMIPITKSWKELGINLKEAPPGTRSSMNGLVPSKLNYNDWLKKQPTAFQNDVLGKTKAQLWRKGGVHLERFIDKAGREYTLAELRANDAAAWQKAFGGKPAVPVPKPKPIEYERLDVEGSGENLTQVLNENVQSKMEVLMKESISRRLTDVEREALSAYTRQSYRSINGYLRKTGGGATPEVDIIDLVKNLDSMFTATSLARNVRAYRGISTNGWKRFIDDAKITKTWIDKGFTSASVQKRVAETFQGGGALEFHVPKGTAAFPTNGLSGHLSETELLFKRGLKWTIKSIDLENRTAILELK